MNSEIKSLIRAAELLLETWVDIDYEALFKADGRDPSPNDIPF